MIYFVSIITILEQQLEKEHFAELLNGKQIPDTPDFSPAEKLDTETDRITKDAIIKALRMIRDGKSPGPDHIPPEVLTIYLESHMIF